MEKITVIKRCIVFFLIVSFLNLTIIPHANAVPESIREKNDKSLLLIGSILAGAILVLVIWTAASKSHSAGNPQTINQALNNISSDSDKMLTPSGELVVFKW